MFNDEGVRYIHKRTKPLNVDSMDKAAEAIDAGLLKALEKRTPVNFADPIERAAYARHLAWIIGFDHLISDLSAIHDVTSLIVK